MRPGQSARHCSLRDAPDYSYRLHVALKDGKLGGTGTIWDSQLHPRLSCYPSTLPVHLGNPLRPGGSHGAWEELSWSPRALSFPVVRPSWQSLDNNGSLDNAYSEAEPMSLHSIPFSLSIPAKTSFLLSLSSPAGAEFHQFRTTALSLPTSLPLPPCFLFLPVQLSGLEEGGVFPGEPHLNNHQHSQREVPVAPRFTSLIFLSSSLSVSAPSIYSLIGKIPSILASSPILSTSNFTPIPTQHLPDPRRWQSQWSISPISSLTMTTMTTTIMLARNYAT